MTAPALLPGRCAAHPSRPAVDACPVCARPRCGADAALLAATGCSLCAALGPAGGSAGRVVRSPEPLERFVRAALASYAVALAGGLIASEYVQSGLFSYVGPFVVGVVCGGAALKAGATDGRGEVGTRVRAISAVLAVLGVAYGFALEASQPILSAGTLLPYVCAAAGAILWTVPPKVRKPAASAHEDATEV